MFDTELKELVETIDPVTEGLGTVVLFNDDWHSFDDVIFQLILATSCSQKTAEQQAFEVHNTGKSKVFNGQLEDCLMVSAILEDISLKTEIIH